MEAMWRNKDTRRTASKIGSRLLALLLSEVLEEQFSRRPRFFCGIARGTAWHHIAFRTPSTPGDWHNVVHSQCVGSKNALTVGTESLGKFVTPPL